VRLLHIPFGGQRLAHRSRITGERDLDGQYVATGARRRVSVKRSFACTISTERK